MNKYEELTDPEIYVAKWAEKQRKIEASGLPYLLLAHEKDVRVYNTAFPAHKLRGISKVYLEAAFEVYLKEQPKLLREQLALSINGRKENLKPMKAWVKAVTGKEDATDLNVMLHWIWLVKRNSLKLPVVHHIMPIITSARQGGGKSTAVKSLLEPINELTLELKVPQVVDERSFTMFENYLIGFFDEMAGADKVEISDFKRNVTSSTLTYRPMRTNFQQKINNLCSFIGASNSEIYEIIKDTSGIRRFFPIKALDLLDHDAINAVNYLELWQGIDETKERGYYENVQAKIAMEQEDLAIKDGITLFLEEHSIIPGEYDEDVLVSGKDIYAEYLNYCGGAGSKYPVQRQIFYKRLKSAGMKAVQKRDNRKILCWYFSVRKESRQTIGSVYDN